MSIITYLISNLAPIFLILSPLLSYTDQILSILRTRSSAGFSLDIPLIMLTASILKIFYWPPSRYDPSLLIQAVIMVGVQAILLKVALVNRPAWRGEGLALRHESKSGVGGGLLGGFWRWKAERPYWEYLGLLTLGLWAGHTFMHPGPKDVYTMVIGYVGLAIEAFLPVPQIMENRRKKSCKGFRVSVLANWLVGDAMKMGFFFLAEDDKVPWAFKCCGVFQAMCDAGLGVQWWMYGDGPPSAVGIEK